jgi:hypothetical protein
MSFTKFNKLNKEEFVKDYVSRMPTYKMVEKYGVSEVGLSLWRKRVSIGVRRRVRPDLSEKNRGVDRSGKNNGNFGKIRNDKLIKRVKKQNAYKTEEFNELRNIVIKRDGWCVICGDCDRLNVHHIDYDESGLDERKVITLCNGCHAKTNKNRELWHIIFERILEQIYSDQRMNEGGELVQSLRAV